MYEFENFLANTSDYERILNTLKEYHHTGRLEAFLDKFDAYKQSIPVANAVPYLSAVFSIGDIVTGEMRGFFHISSIHRIQRLIHWFLKKDEIASQRKQILKDAINATEGTFVPLFILFNEIQRQDEDKHPDHYSFEAMDKPELQQMAIDLVHRSATSIQFKDNIHLPRIISIWKHLDKSSAQSWFSKQLSDDEFLLSFLNRTISKGLSSSGYETKPLYTIEVGVLKEFFEDIEALFSRIASLRENPMHIESNHLLFETLAKTEARLHSPGDENTRFQE